MAEKRLPSPYEDYAVDESGKVWSYKRDEKSEVAARPDATGYLRVNLSNSEEPNGFKDIRVHELVARAFLGPKPSPAHEVLHANDDPSDNRAANLRWGTKKENGEDRREDAEESYSPPKGAQTAAAKGLRLREKFGRGGTAVGVARARDLSNGKNVSRETVGRMRSFFARHGAQKVEKGWENSEDPSAQWIAWLLWGGNAGKEWAEGLRLDEEYLRADSFKVGEWKVTAEGYLEATAVIARVGELIYEGPDGPYSEFVTEDALKNDAESLNGKPVTFEHPPEGEVTAENFRKYAVGVIQEARYDSDLKAQVAKIIVHDADTIKRVMKDGIREVSPGYRATIRRGPDGPQQIRRANNHVAITTAGRGGPESSIRLDSKGHVIITREDTMENEEPKVDMKAQLDAMMAEKADMLRKMDAMQAKIDAYEAMAAKKDMEGEESEAEEEAPKMDSAEFVRLFNERNEILGLGETLGVKLDSNATNADLKAVVVREALGAEVRCDSAEAVNGMFEAVQRMTPKKNSLEHLGDTFRRNDSKALGTQDDLFSFYDESRRDSLLFGKE